MNSVSSTTDTFEKLPRDKQVSFLLTKLFVYFFRYLDNPKYLYLYLSRVISKSYSETVNFMSDEKFLEKAQNHSTIRFGDGEFGLLLGKRGIHYQDVDIELRQTMEKIIKEYCPSSPYILGIPLFITVPNNQLDKYNLKYLWLPGKILYRMLFPKTSLYFNSHFFYKVSNLKNFLLKTTNGRNIVWVTNDLNIVSLKEREKIFFPQALSISYIETPGKNAFSVYESLYNKALGCATEKNTVIFIACGPAGKVLVYDLAIQGVLAHDIGHGINFALSNSQQKDPATWPIFEKHWKKISR